MQRVWMDSTPACPSASQNSPAVYCNPKRVRPPSGRRKSQGGA
ncbi:MAG: hypothetical protein QXX51_03860 [Candidatus Bathyarchaeia archaeon]